MNMTAEEQKRNRLLARILPGMAITVIYFIFISGILSEKMTKAEDAHNKLLQKGISSASMPGVINQQNQTRTQISTLEKKHAKFKQKLKDLAGFLSNTTPSNESSTLLSSILLTHQIRVKNEQREIFAEADLSPALKEVWQWLKPESKDDKANDIFVQHLSLTASYQNMYLALATIAQGKLKAVPVSFNMSANSEASTTNDDLDWELLLWM